MSRVDARVDDRDGDLLEPWQRDPRLVEAAVGEVPLLRDEGIRGREGEVPRDERLDVANTGDAAYRDSRGDVDDERRDRLEALWPGSGPSLDRGLDGLRVGSVSEPDGHPRRTRRRWHDEPRGHGGGDEDEALHPVTWTGSDVPPVRSAVAAVRARYVPVGTASSSILNPPERSTTS